MKKNVMDMVGFFNQKQYDRGSIVKLVGYSTIVIGLYVAMHGDSMASPFHAYGETESSRGDTMKFLKHFETYSK